MADMFKRLTGLGRTPETPSGMLMLLDIKYYLN